MNLASMFCLNWGVNLGKWIWVDLVKMRLFGLKEMWYDLSGHEWKVDESLYMTWLIKFNKL